MDTEKKNQGVELVSRRRFFGSSAVAAAGAFATGSALAQTVGSICKLTPAQTSGPFYPVKDQPDEDNDLTLVRGVTQKAQGKLIYILGQLQDQECKPVQGALVEIWQACASGKYNHPNDDNPAPLDRAFQYWGKSISDDQGRYLFKTILPGAYPADPTWTRPPHIHFKLSRLGYHELITQMYFAGNSLNSTDKILLSLPQAQRQSVIVPLELPQAPLDPNSRVCRFNLTLRKVM